MIVFTASSSWLAAGSLLRDGSSSLLAASRFSQAAGRMMDAFADDTFKGVHHLMPFDWAMLIPYFTVLIILYLVGVGH